MKILRKKEVAKKIGLSLSSIWRLERADEGFPKRKELGQRSVGWVEEDIDIWLASRPQVEGGDK